MQDFCTWNVRGLNIPLDLEDAETSKNYQQAAELLKAFGTQEQLSNEAERIRADCAVIRSFLLPCWEKRPQIPSFGKFRTTAGCIWIFLKNFWRLFIGRRWQPPSE